MPEKSIEQRMAEAEMAKRKAQTPTQTPSYTPPSNPVPTPPAYNANPSNLPDTKTGTNGQTLYRIGSTYGTYNPNQPNQAQLTQMANQVQKTGTVSDYYAGAFGLNNKAPEASYIPIPPSYGVDDKGKPRTEQDWLASGGLLAASGKNNLNSYKTYDGRYLDTTGWTPQQVHAAQLWDGVAAGKRTQESAMAILQGMGLDRHGNSVPGYGGVPTPPINMQNNAFSASSSLPVQNFDSVPVPGMVGGFTYGTDAAKSKALTSNLNLWNTDSAAKADEIARTQKVITDMKAANPNADVSAQEKHLYQTLGYKPNVDTIATEQPNPVPDPNMSYEEMARGEFAEQLASKESWASAQKASLQQAFDRSNQLTADQRALQNWEFEDKNTPFAGRTSYLKSTLGRERTLADAASRDQYNAAIAGIESELSNFRNTIDQQVKARAEQLRQQAIDQAMREAELTGTYNGGQTLAAKTLSFNQDLALSEFNQKTAQQQWENTFAEKQFTEDQARKLWEQQFKEKTFDQEVKQAAKRMGLDWAQLSQRDKEFVAEQAYREKSFALETKKFEASQGKPGDYSAQIKSIENMYIATDPYTKQTKVSNPTAMRNAIIALNMSDEETDKYLTIYGLPTN